MGWGRVGMGREGCELSHLGSRWVPLVAPTGYLWSKYECFLISGCKDRLQENLTQKYYFLKMY